MTNLMALREGTELVKDYRIKRVLGAGGFGITYLAEETPLARDVTIKEYFPSDFAARDGASQAVPRSEQCEGDYKWGLERFIEEGQTLARFNHPNIVRVYRYFEANNTAYIVLHFEEGASFKGWLKGLGRAPRQAELDAILVPLLDALEIIHAADFLHRDIAPDNIIIRKDGSPVLIDFGAARGEIAQHSRTVSALVKPGYSPYEQYATAARTQGPWSDIYSLGSTLYQAISGKRPSDAPTRMVGDDYVPAREAALSAYRPRFLAAIDKALRLEIKERPQTVKAWRSELLAVEPKPARRKAEPSGTTRKAEATPVPPPVAPSPAPIAPVAAARVAASAPAAEVAVVTAPPRSGGLLREFMAGFRRGDAVLAAASSAEPAARPPVPAAAVAVAPAPEPAAPAPPPVARSTAAATAKPRRSLPRVFSSAPSPERHAPRPVRPPLFSKRRLRSLGVKLLIGIGVAAAAVTLQEHWPQVESRGSSTLSSGEATSGKAATKVASAAKVAAPAPSPASAPAPVPAPAYAPVPAPAPAPVHDPALTPAPAPAMLPPAAALPMPPTAAMAAAPPPPPPAVAAPAREGVPIGQIMAHRGVVSGLAFSDGGQQIVSAGADATIKVWTVAGGGKLVRTIELDNGAPSSLAVRGHRAVTGHKDGTFVVWDLERGDKLATFKRGPGEISATVFLADVDRIATATPDGAVALWDLPWKSAPAHVLEGHEGAVYALSYAAKTGVLASGGADRAIRMWDVAGPGLVRSYRGHQDAISALAFSPDMRLLASAAVDGRIRIWSTQSSRSYRTLRGHVGRIWALGFAPSASALVASAGQDGTVRLWDIRRGRTARTFWAAAGESRAIAFSPDGRQLASAGSDGVVRIWDTSAVATRE